MKDFICKNCGIDYKSNKKNSKFCSMKCRREYNSIPYNCDYCNTPMIITRGQAEKLKNGERTGRYCSKECHDKSQITSAINICKNCKKEYKVFKCFKNTQQFCSRDCYYDYRERNARKNIPKECPVCKKIFYSEAKNPIFCSYECSSISQQKREACTCEYCGKEFSRIVSEVAKNKHHYCSKICKQLAQQWSESDRMIVRNNYKKIPNRDILPLLSKSYTENALKSEAGRLGLYQSRLWSEAETETLKNLYPTVPLNDVLKALPNRSFSSIMGKSRVLRLKSWFYLNNTYSDEDNNFLKENYLRMTNLELGEKLGRGQKAIQQHLWALGLTRPFDPRTVCYKDLYHFVRSRIETWRNHYREECNYICSVTGRRDNIVVHHCRSFNLLMSETIEMLDFKILDNFSLYSGQELEDFVIAFLDLQEYYGEYVCVNTDIHKLFHNHYGYGNNTMEQWNKFVAEYHQGIYSAA